MSASLEMQAAEWVAANHPHARHLERTRHWLLEIDPGADEGERVAALLHDIERAYPDPDSPYDSARDWADPAYNRYHQDRCARYAEAWLGERGAGAALTEQVVDLVRVHEQGGRPAADVLQAADSLSFLEVMGPLIGDWIESGRTSREQALGKLHHSFDRIQVERGRELGRPLLEAALRGQDEVVAR